MVKGVIKHWNTNVKKGFSVFTQRMLILLSPSSTKLCSFILENPQYAILINMCVCVCQRLLVLGATNPVEPPTRLDHRRIWPGRANKEKSSRRPLFAEWSPDSTSFWLVTDLMYSLVTLGRSRTQSHLSRFLSLSLGSVKEFVCVLPYFKSA